MNEALLQTKLYMPPLRPNLVPRQHLIDLTRFIGVTPEKEYVDACNGVLFAKPRQTKSSVDWPDDLIDMVTQRIDKYPFLRGYEFAEPAPVDVDKAA